MRQVRDSSAASLAAHSQKGTTAPLVSLGMAHYRRMGQIVLVMVTDACTCQVRHIVAFACGVRVLSRLQGCLLTAQGTATWPAAHDAGSSAVSTACGRHVNGSVHVWAIACPATSAPVRSQRCWARSLSGIATGNARCISATLANANKHTRMRWRCSTTYVITCLPLLHLLRLVSVTLMSNRPPL